MGRTRETGNLVSENAIYVNIDNDRVGIGSTLPSTLLDVAGTISGNAANISGIVTASSISVTDINSSGIITASSISVTDINSSGIITASGGFGIGISSSGGVITSGPIKTLNFVGAGNTFSVVGDRVDISISGSGGGGGGSNPWTRKTSNYTAVAGDQLIVDTTGGTFTITLPAEPSEGDSIKLADGGNWNATSFTVARNGNKIEGDVYDIIVDLQGIIVEFIYEDSTDGWQIYSYAGPPSNAGVDVLECMMFT